VKIRQVVAVVAVAAGVTFAGAAVPAMASARHDTAWWNNRTISAYWAYEHKPSAARFAALDRDSRHAYPYLRYDVGQWWHDVRAGASDRVIAFDAWCTWVDITMSPDQAASQ
jgi:hypothetical protein